MKREFLPTETVLLREDKLKRKLFDDLCANEDDVVILEWTGRSERRKDQKRGHRSRFDRPFDVVCFKRQKNKSFSPLLIAYEVKGIRKHGSGYRRPSVNAGVDQLLTYVDHQDADYAYLITIPRKNPKENEHIEQTIRSYAGLGLKFAEVKGNDIVFEPVVKPKKRNPKVNIDKKKANLIAVSLREDYVTEIRRQEWGRKAEFVLP